MKPEEQKIGKLLKNSHQYIIPRFQRHYVWGVDENDDTKGQVRIFWNDILEITRSSQLTHFTGSIVIMQDVAKTSDVDAYMVIDGQQRLITTSLLFCALKKFTNKNGAIESRLINEDYTIHGNFKIIVADEDKDVYQAIINGLPIPAKKFQSSAIKKAYDYFVERLQEIADDPVANGCTIDDIYNTVADRLQIICIILEKEDPGAIFESLNYKGQSLTRVDLIKNYLLMNFAYEPDKQLKNIPDEQTEFITNDWKPLATKLIGIRKTSKRTFTQDYLEPFIRHYLMINGDGVPFKSVYSIFKSHVKDRNEKDSEKEGRKIPLSETIHLIVTEMSAYADLYRYIVHIEEYSKCESSSDNARINLSLSTMLELKSKSNGCYLLKLFKNHEDGLMTDHEFVQSICLVESYLMRRTMVQGGLNPNVVDVLFQKLCKNNVFKPNDLKEELEKEKKAGIWPSDDVITNFFKYTAIYDKWDYTKLVLNRINWFLNEKEPVISNENTIEHMMPETRSKWWISHTDDTYDAKLHILGNLALTGYNSELSNSPYPDKLKWYKKSNNPITRAIYENKEYNKEWSMDIIDSRGLELIGYILQIWPRDIIE